METEMVAVAIVLPQSLLTRYFPEEQGYFADHIIMQDNDSVHNLKVNGRVSSGKTTQHMNIRYFFIKDQVDFREVLIQRCPTDDMVGDYFKKPLQGANIGKI